MPPVLQPAKSLTQGGVLDGLHWGRGENEPLGIVLSNACDLEHHKAGFVIVAALVPAAQVLSVSREYRDLVEEASPEKRLTRKRWDALRRLLTTYVHNQEIRRYFYVDASSLGLEDLLADFQNLHAFSMREVHAATLIAELGSPDREKIIMHFAAYSSRIGVARASDQDVEHAVDRLSSPYRSPAPR